VVCRLAPTGGSIAPAHSSLETRNSGAWLWPVPPGVLFDSVDRNFFGERLWPFGRSGFGWGAAGGVKALAGS